MSKVYSLSEFDNAHYIITIDSINKSINVYKNGTLINSSTLTESYYPFIDKIKFLESGGAVINDLIVYSKILSDNQIKKLSTKNDSNIDYDNVWTYLSVLLNFDDNEIHLYKNANLVGSNVDSFSIDSNTSNIVLGKDLLGKIDNVSLYERIISKNEIINNYNRTVNISNINLLNCVFDANVKKTNLQTINDSSLFKNNGIVNNTINIDTDIHYSSDFGRAISMETSSEIVFDTTKYEKYTMKNSLTSCWIKLSTLNSNFIVSSKSNSYIFEVTSSRKLKLTMYFDNSGSISNKTFESTFTVDNSAWIFIGININTVNNKVQFVKIVNNKLFTDDKLIDNTTGEIFVDNNNSITCKNNNTNAVLIDNLRIDIGFFRINEIIEISNFVKVFEVLKVNKDEFIDIAITYSKSQRLLKLYHNAQLIGEIENYLVDINSGNINDTIDVGEYKLSNNFIENKINVLSEIHIDKIKIFNEVLDNDNISLLGI
jgi:hypothetical protein